MLILDAVLFGGSDWLADDLFLAQIPGSGWMVVPIGYMPSAVDDPWSLYIMAETYREEMREERGY
jgi:hypothetical protein